MLLIELNEGTAARRRVPVALVDDTDGKTAETGVTIAAGDMKVSKNGAAEANHGGTLTELAGGDYYYECSAGEVDTVGYLTGRIVKAGVRTFRIAAQVVAFDPYAAANLGLTNLDAAISTRSSHAAADIWAVATRALTDKAGFSLSAAGVQAIWDALTAALSTANSIGKLLVDNLNATISSRASQASVDTIDDFVDTEIAATLEDTGTTIDDLVDDLEARLTAALADKLAKHGAAVLALVVGAGSTTTAVKCSTVEGAAPSAVNDFYNGRVIVFTSGALAGQACEITDYVGATTTATVSALTGAPADTVTAVIV